MTSAVGTAIGAFGLSYLLFAFVWIGLRRSRRMAPSDVLAMALSVACGPGILFDVTAQSAIMPVAIAPATAAAALHAAALMYGVLAIAYLFRPVFAVEPILPATARTCRPFALGAAAAALILFGTLSAFAPFLDLRLDVVRFVCGLVNPESYSVLRRVAYGPDVPLIGMLDRLRFSLMPVLFVFVVLAGLLAGRWSIAFVLGLLFFFLLPGSLSKLPFLVYGTYFVLAAAVARSGGTALAARRLLAWAPGLILVLLCGLALLLAVQYQAGAASPDRILDLAGFAVRRVFVETYAVLLRYFLVYPEHAPFAGFAASSLLGGLGGEAVRNTDVEVAAFVFGAGVATTNPTIFIGNAYALGGYPVVAAFSAGVGLYAVLADRLVMALRHGAVAAAAYVVLSVNIGFFAIVSPLTCLLTFGLGLFPPLFLVLDRLALRTAYRHAGRHRPGGKYPAV